MLLGTVRVTAAVAQVLARLGEEVLWRVAGEVPSFEVRVDSPAVDEVLPHDEAWVAC